MPRRSAAAVADSRAQTLSAAVELASVRGLEGLTIGGLADTLAMSKSGLVGRFGTKLELQLAVLERAADVFRDHCLRAGGGRPGRPPAPERDLRRMDRLPRRLSVPGRLLPHHGLGRVRCAAGGAQRRRQARDAPLAARARARSRGRGRERRAGAAARTPRTLRSRSTRLRSAPTATSSSIATGAPSSARAARWRPCSASSSSARSSSPTAPRRARRYSLTTVTRAP